MERENCIAGANAVGTPFGVRTKGGVALSALSLSARYAVSPPLTTFSAVAAVSPLCAQTQRVTELTGPPEREHSAPRPETKRSIRVNAASSTEEPSKLNLRVRLN